MGGGMAFHMAYRYQREVAGCFALSSFLNNDSVVYKVRIILKSYALILFKKVRITKKIPDIRSN